MKRWSPIPLILVALIIGVQSITLNASEPGCFVGEWKLDADASDSAERLLDKLKRKQKQQEQFRGRPVIGVDDNKQDLSLPDTIPRFVFDLDNLLVSMEPGKVNLQQGDRMRELLTDGSSRAVSLSKIEEQGNSVVAGWDQGRLVVETTTLKGSHVNEIYSLVTPEELHIHLVISHELEKKATEMEKIYRRTSLLPQNCGQ